MSQVFGYICSDDSLTSEVMKEYGAPLRAIEPDERVGLGIGLLQDGRSLLRKHPRRKATSVDVPSLLGDIASQSIVGHVRHQRSGTPNTRDLQPFRFRNWVFSQHCDETRLQGAYDSLRDELPDHIERNIEGGSMAELMFHIFYTKVESELSTTPKSQWPELYAAKLAETMSQVQKRAANGADESVVPMVAVAVTDRCVVCGRIGQPVHYRLIEGIEETTEEPLFAGHNPKAVMHDRFRALLVANEVDDPEWSEMPNHSILWADDDWNIEVAPVEELC